VANSECRLVQIIKPGDCPLVIGKVEAAHAHVART
jgi:flavin reductase (DIM6/NTAB) family NADH-FMN oxidoreductase RutF